MELFTRNELHNLTEVQQRPCVSIYMPTHRIPSEITQDRIRLKNLLRQADQALQDYGLRAPEAQAILDPAERLLTQLPFWQRQKDGLALFLAPEFFRDYLLPTTITELVVVTDRFHLKPMLSLLSGDGSFYILALSQNEVRLLQGTRFRVSEVILEEMPQSLAEALKFEEQEKQLQFHTRTPKAGGDRTAMFHGHGVGTDDAKDRILRYFRQIDKGLQELLRNEQAPLVLAGVDYLLPIYQEVNSYGHLIDHGIIGNPQGLSAEELHAQAWGIIAPYFQQSQLEAAAKYRQLAGTGKTSKEIKEIAPAAYHGRIEALFVAVGRQQWGTFDPQTTAVELHSEPEPKDQDLLDLAALHTLLRAGQVFVAKPEEMPEDSPVAAVFRC
ncbi:MAG: hypothetical protein JRI57_02245 [Deltaproteobacteria bacterium]|nr:hypothetical protein [Deltaproteobacteria bacterium]